MARQLEDGFLQEYVAFGSDTEVPSLFSLWAGIYGLSVVLGRDCYVEFGHGRIYPNLYVVLVAGSAKCRKSTAIGGIERMLKKLEPEPNMLSQKMTPEFLIHSLRGCPQEVEGGTVIRPQQCEGHFIVDEMATLVDSKAFQSGLIPLLTTLWDSKDFFEYGTRSRGKETILNSYVTLLGGSTAQWIREAIPVVAIGGGFTSRIMFIYQESPEKMIAFPEMSVENRIRQPKLQHDLAEMAAIRGRFILTAQAKRTYAREYEKFRNEHPFMLDKNLEGYGGRRHIMSLKLSMIICASERDDKIIQDFDMIRAIKILEQAEKGMPTVMQAITSETVGDYIEEVLRLIKNKKIIKRSVLIGKFRNKMSSRDLAAIMETLIEEKIVVAESTSGDITYAYRGK